MKALHRAIAKRPELQATISDERSSRDGIWVYFAKGWINPALEAHCIHEDTVRECAAQIAGIVRCVCEGCSAKS